MITEPDKKISEAKECIDKASKTLAEVLTNDELENYTYSYQKDLIVCLNLLLDAKLTIKDE